MELFSALDNALSQKAQDTLTEFAAVKKADVQLQTPLGNRQAQIGINIMGAFAESQNSAFGWQVRAFGGCVLDNIGGAKNQAQEGYCRLPIADCRLPIADCRLPIAMGIYGNSVCGHRAVLVAFVYSADWSALPLADDKCRCGFAGACAGIRRRAAGGFARGGAGFAPRGAVVDFGY